MNPELHGSAGHGFGQFRTAQHVYLSLITDSANDHDVTMLDTSHAGWSDAIRKIMKRAPYRCRVLLPPGTPLCLDKQMLNRIKRSYPELNDRRFIWDIHFDASSEYAEEIWKTLGHPWEDLFTISPEMASPPEQTIGNTAILTHLLEGGSVALVENPYPRFPEAQILAEKGEFDPDELVMIRYNDWIQVKVKGPLLGMNTDDDDLQKKRLQNTYPDDWKVHWDNREIFGQILALILVPCSDLINPLMNRLR